MRQRMVRGYEKGGKKKNYVGDSKSLEGRTL